MEHLGFKNILKKTPQTWHGNFLQVTKRLKGRSSPTSVSEIAQGPGGVAFW